MAIKFKVLERGSQPGVKEAPKKWYASVQTDGELSMGDIVKQIEKFSALSEADIHGVVIGLENVIQEALSSGKIVRLEKLGTLYPTLSSGPAETEKEFHSGLIKSVGGNYRPRKRILDAMKAAGFEKVK